MNEHISSIDKVGYTLLKNVFSKSVCEKAKVISCNYIKSQKIDFNDNISESILADKSQEKVLNNLQNKDYFYFNFFANKEIYNIIKHFLKRGSYEDNEPFHLINSQIRALEPYAKKQQLHLDSNLPAQKEFPLVMVAIIMLDDFTRENGATRVVPKSHLNPYYAENGKDYDNEIQINGKAGDVIILNGSLWHGSDNNTTSKERWSINLGYGRWFIKPSYDIPRALKKDIYFKANQFERNLLGLKTVPPIDEYDRLTRKSLEDFLPWEKNEV